MALFGCTECGEKVSSEAEACPKCGASVPAMVSKIMATTRRQRTPAKRISNTPENKETLGQFLAKPLDQHSIRLQVIVLAIVGAVFAAYFWPEAEVPPVKHTYTPSPKTDGVDRYGAVDTSDMPTYQPHPTSSGGVKAQFSGWDGSHIALTKLIKARLNDPGSYEHDKTAHVLKDGKMFIMARFRATNGFGALVLQNVTAQASAKDDGKDVTILSWE